MDEVLSPVEEEEFQLDQGALEEGRRFLQQRGMERQRQKEKVVEAEREGQGAVGRFVRRSNKQQKKNSFSSCYSLLSSAGGGGRRKVTISKGTFVATAEEDSYGPPSTSNCTEVDFGAAAPSSADETSSPVFFASPSSSSAHRRQRSTKLFWQRRQQQQKGSSRSQHPRRMYAAQLLMRRANKNKSSRRGQEKEAARDDNWALGDNSAPILTTPRGTLRRFSCRELTNLPTETEGELTGGQLTNASQRRAAIGDDGEREKEEMTRLEEEERRGPKPARTAAAEAPSDSRPSHSAAHSPSKRVLLVRELAAANAAPDHRRPPIVVGFRSRTSHCSLTSNMSTDASFYLLGTYSKKLYCQFGCLNLLKIFDFFFEE